MGDHTETFQVDYDPTLVTYEELLEVFWSAHDPTGRNASRQYMRAVFVHDAEQRRLAERTAREALAGQGGESGKLTTPILDLESFHLAEAYHQKYSLRRLSTVERELEAYYPELEDFVRSTAATRINALAGGNGTRAELEALAGELGLSSEALAELDRAVY